MRGFGLLARFGRKPEPEATRIVDLGRIEGPVYAVGDVHGCRSLLRTALEAIHKDANVLKHDPTVVLLGDVVDRGPDSAGVLDDLTRDVQTGKVLSVLGNHERMMLSFLHEPLKAWDWLQQGGFETLRSYGLSLPPSEKHNARRVRQMLQAHIPDHHIDWLKALPHGYRTEIDGKAYVLSHAGLDATRPIDAQTEGAMLWGRNVTASYPGVCIVQGHVMVERPRISDGLIRIDTGAYTTGILSVLRISAGKPASVMSFDSKTF